MEKRTLKFDCLINLAMFSKNTTAGFLMNTNNFTLTGRFTDDDIAVAQARYNAKLIETTEKVYSYGEL